MIGEIIIHVVLFCLMLLLYVEAFKFPILNRGGSLGAAWWPQLVLFIGMLLLVLSLFLSIRKASKNKTEEKGPVKISKVEVIALSISFAIIAAGLLIVSKTGFLVSAFLMCIGFMFLLGQRKVWLILVASLVMALVFVVVFGRFMQVSLPRGQGFFRTISYWFY